MNSPTCTHHNDSDQLRLDCDNGTKWGAQQLENTIMFCCGPESREIMRLDRDGMTYKGQRIEDGGEAHRAFLVIMSAMREAAK